jgi:hypothetical protein
MVKGILRQGYGVASGASHDYPYGALERQIPIFKSRGLDLGDCFPGTLNLDIQPLVFNLFNPEFTFRDVRWTDLHPPEHFSFSSCKVAFAGAEYDAWIYYPHPETKQRNFQRPSLLEVIARLIPAVRTGDGLDVYVHSERVTIERPDSS